jgi:hypothetical protein
MGKKAPKREPTFIECIDRMMFGLKIFGWVYTALVIAPMTIMIVWLLSHIRITF